MIGKSLEVAIAVHVSDVADGADLAVVVAFRARWFAAAHLSLSVNSMRECVRNSSTIDGSIGPAVQVGEESARPIPHLLAIDNYVFLFEMCTYFEDGEFQSVLVLVIFHGRGDHLPNGYVLAGLSEASTVQLEARLGVRALAV